MPIPGLLAPAVIVATRVLPRYIDVGYSANINLRNLHDQYYNTWPSRTVVVFTVSSYVFSNAYYAPAMDVSGFPGDWEIYLINNGHIRGAGGRGGDWDNANPAQNGGTALYLRNYVSIQNNGTIAGGGGGGGGTLDESSGGGGGAGVVAAGGGYHYPGFGNAPSGDEYNGGYVGHPGGAGSGGGWGQPGLYGYDGGGGYHGWPNGAAGYCWDGGGYIKSFGTWDSARNIWTNTGNPGTYVGPGA